MIWPNRTPCAVCGETEGQQFRDADGTTRCFDCAFGDTVDEVIAAQEVLSDSDRSPAEVLTESVKTPNCPRKDNTRPIDAPSRHELAEVVERVARGRRSG